MKMFASQSSRLLAVWWYDGNSFFGVEEPLDGPNVEMYGGFLGLPFTHMDTWDDFNPIGLGAEYDEIPRGRTVYKISTNQFYVYTSSALASDEEFKTKMRSFYGLPYNTEFLVDEHYDSF